MTTSPNTSMTRRRFAGVLGMSALGARSLAQKALFAPVSGAGIVELPSAYFGKATPEQAGFKADLPVKMAAYLQSQIAAGVIPGAFVAATRHGKLFLEQAHGTFCTRTERGAPYTGAALHPVHSISKMSSATAVVMAWQDGLIDIDVPVAKYVPEFGNHGKEVITIRQLLTHSAGIPLNPPGPMRTGTEDEWKASVAAVCAMPLQWEPGSQVQYHGMTGMLIAAEAVRRASNGKTWNDICRERVFTPLGASTLTFGEPPADLPLACIPWLQNPSAQWQAQVDMFMGNPAAGLKGSMADILKLLALHSNHGVWQGKTLLKEKYWREMHTNQFPGKPLPQKGKPGYQSWGLGMMVRSNGPQTDALSSFGLPDLPRPNMFGHAGTSIAIAVGDPDTDTQLVFIVTDAPKIKQQATDLRATVVATIFNSMKNS